MNQYQIYWWNLENLFDREDSPDRPDWLQKSLAKELKGWTQEVLDKKIENLSRIIMQFNSGNGPDILGVCEIENKNVIDLLAKAIGVKTNRNYKTIHHDTNDQRGIDIAFLFDTKKFKTVGKLFSLEIMKRSATRDVIQMTFKTKSKHEITILGIHFPSRTGGQYETEPYRIMAAETVAYWIRRIHEKKGQDHPIVLMGDFNDEPFNRSLTKYLLSTHTRQKILKAQNHLMFNCMYSFLGNEIGSHVFGNEVTILDQFLVSKHLISNNSGNYFKLNCAEIVAYPEMIKGKYNTPIRFSRPSANDYNPDGFSDHLPVKLVIDEK